MRFLADENFDNNITRGLLRRLPDLDVVRVQDVGLTGVDDPTILRWCAREDRIALTHDRSTMVGFALARLDAGEVMSGLVVVDDRAGTGTVLDDLLLIIECAAPEELQGQVWFVPMR